MDLSRNIIPLPIREPSTTLFSLLGLLMDTLRELSSVTEVMSGEQPRANMPAASIDMLIEQGKKLFNSVYKRHYRSLSKEQNVLFDLNFLYQDPQAYIDLLDMEIPADQAMALVQGDFSRVGIDLIPTANPEFSSRIERMSKAQALLNLKDFPEVNGTEITRMYIETVVDDSEVAAQLVPEQPNITPQQAMQQMEQQKQEFLNSNEARKSEAETKEAEVRLEMAMLEAQLKGVKMPMEVEKAELANERAAIAVQNEIAKGENIESSESE